MHCDCCNKLLTDVESRIKFKESGVFANTCLTCLDTMDVAYSLPRDEYDIEEEDVFYDIDDSDVIDNQEYWDER